MLKLICLLLASAMMTVLTAQSANHSATLTWVASATDATHDTPTGYNVKRSAVSGGPYTTVGSTASPTTTYVDSTVLGGATYFFVVTAFNGGGESVPSNQVTCTVPFQKPQAPTGLSAVTQ